MKLPQRDIRHITESSSYKIFSKTIPDHWIIREVTERDYGIDCYIELVNNDNQVTGDLVSIQLKGMKSIKWTKKNYYTYSNVNISTTNYWYRFPIPVFLCLVDLEKEEAFFSAVKSEVRKNFFSYAKQDKFSYRIYQANQLNAPGMVDFLLAYFKEKQNLQLADGINTFLSHYHYYTRFIADNIGRDCFMGVDIDRVLYLKAFYRNIQSLCAFFGIKWEMKSLKEYFKESQKAFGDHYDIHEHFIDEIVRKLEELMPPISLKIKDHITDVESEYWQARDHELFNFVININDEGEVPAFI